MVIISSYVVLCPPSYGSYSTFYNKFISMSSLPVVYAFLIMYFINIVHVCVHITLMMYLHLNLSYISHLWLILSVLNTMLNKAYFIL